MKYDFISALAAVASNYKLWLILHHLILSFIPVFMLHIAVETKPAQLTLEFLTFQCYILAAASALHGQHESSVLSLLSFSLPVPALLLPGFMWALQKRRGHRDEEQGWAFASYLPYSPLMWFYTVTVWFHDTWVSLSHFHRIKFVLLLPPSLVARAVCALSPGKGYNQNYLGITSVPLCHSAYKLIKKKTK